MRQWHALRTTTVLGRVSAKVIGLGACVCAALLGGAGCTTAKDAAVPQVRVRAAEDLECPSKKIEVVSELGGRYRATGCGRTVVYHTVCEHLECRVGLEGESAPAWRDRPEPGSIEEGR